ncbi:MAG: hypothetical protein FWE84_03225 [Firmicutes bacterium]|nr:hypothetical protein [Bacillota bacterium]
MKKIKLLLVMLLVCAMAVGVFAACSSYVFTFGHTGEGVVQAAADGEDITSGVKLAKGVTVTFWAFPAKDHRVKNWTDGGTMVAGRETTYTATVSKAHDIKVVFEPAIDTTVTIHAIQGITMPSALASPVSKITETEQFTGTVTWDPPVTTTTGRFDFYTVYTATITLTAKVGYHFLGVPTDYFTVEGAKTVTNRSSTGIVTAVFPRTEVPPWMSDLDAVQGATNALDWNVIRNANTLQTAVTSALDLSTEGEYGAIISWSSSNVALIANDGTVTRPAFHSGDTSATLTATISRGSESDTKTFEITVLKTDRNDVEAVADTLAALTWDSIRQDNSAQDTVKTNLLLYTGGLSSAIIMWSSSKTSVVANNGYVNRPLYNTEDEDITLTATVLRGTESATKTFDVTVLQYGLEVLSIQISTTPTKGRNQTGTGATGPYGNTEVLNMAGGIITAWWTDGVTRTVPMTDPGIEVVGWEPVADTRIRVYVEYEGQEAYWDVYCITPQAGLNYSAIHDEIWDAFIGIYANFVAWDGVFSGGTDKRKEAESALLVGICHRLMTEKVNEMLFIMKAPSAILLYLIYQFTTEGLSLGYYAELGDQFLINLLQQYDWDFTSEEFVVFLFEFFDFAREYYTVQKFDNAVFPEYEITYDGPHTQDAAFRATFGALLTKYNALDKEQQDSFLAAFGPIWDEIKADYDS